MESLSFQWSLPESEAMDLLQRLHQCQVRRERLLDVVDLVFSPFWIVTMCSVVRSVEMYFLYLTNGSPKNFHNKSSGQNINWKNDPGVSWINTSITSGQKTELYWILPLPSYVLIIIFLVYIFAVVIWKLHEMRGSFCDISFCRKSCPLINPRFTSIGNCHFGFLVENRATYPAL